MRRALLLLPLLPGLVLAEPEHPHHHHDHAGHHGHETAPAPAAAPTVAPEIYKEFQAIEELAGKSAYAEAERKARALLPLLHDNPGGRALLLRNLATLCGAQRHYADAAEALRQSLELKALPDEDAARARLEMGQYYVAAEDYPKAAAALSAWLEETPSPAPEHFLFLADIRSRLKQYGEAAALVEKAIARAPDPKPQWRQLLLALYHENRDFRGCARVLGELIRLEPENTQYWQQLTGIYQEAGQEPQALAVRQLMYARGLLKSSDELMQLADILRYRGMPTRAAELLEREIGRGGVQNNARNLERLADAWTEARELGKAAAALERAVAQTDSGDTHHRLGRLYSELHDWGKARQALNRALVRGHLKNAGSAYLLLGLAQYRLNAREEARAAFTRALEAPDLRKTAQQWLEHMEREARQRSADTPRSGSNAVGASEAPSRGNDSG